MVCVVVQNVHDGISSPVISMANAWHECSATVEKPYIQGNFILNIGGMHFIMR